MIPFFDRTLRKAMKKIRRTGLFQDVWYRDQHGHHIPKTMEPLEHYVRSGEAMGLTPNPLFDPRYYASQTGADRKNGSYLLHYAYDGWRDGLNPSAAFDGRLYLKRNRQVDCEPLKHFLYYGAPFGVKGVASKPLPGSDDDPHVKAFHDLDDEWKQLLGPEALQNWCLLRQANLLDDDWYETRYMADATPDMPPLVHFIAFGLQNDHAPNRYFDCGWYRETYAGRLGGMAPALHFASADPSDALSPGPGFDMARFLSVYPYLLTEDKHPLAAVLFRKAKTAELHVQSHTDPVLDGTNGIRQGERDHYQTVNESGAFDPAWYKSHHMAGLPDWLPPLTHYIATGRHTGLAPNAYFDPAWYREQIGPGLALPDVLIHYVKDGWREMQDPGPDFSLERYLEAYPDLKKGSIDPLAHYLVYGRREGRRLPQLGKQSAGDEGHFEPGTELDLSRPLRGLIDYAPNSLTPNHAFREDAMTIHWVIPDFAPGSGGHMTIFRMVHLLELKGHKQTIWINCPDQHVNDGARAAYDTICHHFQHFAGDVRFIDEQFENARGDAIIATDCFSALPVLSARAFTRRFYFVQDYEPSFHPMGAHYLIAEQTYTADMDCICASPWLAGLMRDRYGRFADHFMLAADNRIYYPPSTPRVRSTDKPLRIAVYARYFTARRAVELAFLGLELAARQGLSFEVDFFGAKLPFNSAPFLYRNHGVASPETLGDIFRTADIGMVFSATNYSLVPQEMMACALPIIELDGESTRAIFPDDVVTFAAPDPRSIADALKRLIDDDARRSAQANAALAWVSGFSWEGAAETVEEVLKTRTSLFADKAGLKRLPAQAKTHKASVVIPTWNAGPVLERVLDSALNQRAAFTYDILVIDSGSTDQTLDIVKARPQVKLHQIEQADFNHGDTRNLGVELTEGEFVAFLTHDALPANDRWLHSLVTAVEHFGDKAAGGIGKHLAWDEASPYTKRDLNAHFARFKDHPLMVTRHTDPDGFRDRKNPGWRQFLHFYSDNNSIMRRSVWKDIPYPRTKFGEDQLWAWEIIKAGLGKVYAPRAVVYHSHDYGEEETFERTKTESAFFKHYWGYRLLKDEADLAKTLAAVNADDRRWGHAAGLPDDIIEERIRLNGARLRGLLAGAETDTRGLFDDREPAA